MRITKLIPQLIGAALFALLSGASPKWLVAAQSDRATNLLENCQGWALGAANPCEFTDPVYLAYREYRKYYITVPSGAVYDMAITVSSIRGDVDIQLQAPNGTLLASSSERIGDDVVQASRTVLSRSPGNYTLLLQAVAQMESWYIVRIQTTVSVTLLSPSDKAVVSAIAAQCCAPDDDQLPAACITLRAATATNASLQDDLCLQPPNMCNAQGQLTKLVLSGGDTGNLVCPSLPPELGQLTALTVLDWTGNGQVGTLASVASVLGPLSATLRRLYLGRNALSGPLGCELINGTALEVLRLERNLITGSVPACLFSSPSLKHVSLAGNMVGGPLPPLAPGCALVLLDLSENGPPLGVSPGNPGVQGKLPDLSQAVNLKYLNLQSNSLTGTLPPLPSGLQVLQLASNRLSGPLPPSLETAADLRVLDLSNNQITGSLPPSVSGGKLLTVLRLAANRLGGVLPNTAAGWGSYLMDVDLSGNGFEGTEFSELLSRPSLLKLNLAANSLAFDLAAMAAKIPVNNSLLYFNVSYNNVYGQLGGAGGEALGRMALFSQLMTRVVQDDEALQTSLPPQPLFDISYNAIKSAFPLKLLPLLASLYWASPYDYIPLSVQLQPQKPSGGLDCPLPSTAFPPDVAFLDELQQLYDLSCTTQLGQRINISAFQNVTIPRPPKRPAPPRPPPPLPPRPPIRRPPPPPPGTNTTTTPTPGNMPSGPSLESAVKPAANSSSSSSADPGSSDSGGSSGGGLQGSAVDGGGGGGSGQLQPAATTATDRSGSGSSGGSAKGGAGVGAIAGGVVGGVLVLLLVAVAVGVVMRRNKSRKNAYASKRTPLTFNSAYEAPSVGTASNYGDMQLFEFSAGDRPPRHRTRMQ